MGHKLLVVVFGGVALLALVVSARYLGRSLGTADFSGPPTVTLVTDSSHPVFEPARAGRFQSLAIVDGDAVLQLACLGTNDSATIWANAGHLMTVSDGNFCSGSNRGVGYMMVSTPKAWGFLAGDFGELGSDTPTYQADGIIVKYGTLRSFRSLTQVRFIAVDPTELK